MIRNALTFRCERPDFADRFIDVRYTDLIEAPLDAVEAVYKAFGLELTPEALENMKNYIHSNAKIREKMMKHKYRLEEYGLNEALVEHEFEQYYQSGLLSGQPFSPSVNK